MMVASSTGLESSQVIELTLRRIVLISGLANLTLRIEMLPRGFLMRFCLLTVVMLRRLIEQFSSP